VSAKSCKETGWLSVIVITLFTLGTPIASRAQGALSTSESGAPAPAAAAQTAAQLQQLVAPIALYPDPLVAQILAGSQYPTQIVEADRWVRQNSSLTGSQLQSAIANQGWEPSVMALAQFPSVLSNMDTNLSWTSALGDAYYNQPQDVMNAIQALRSQAYQAGTLKTTPQQTVTVQSGTGSTTVTTQGNQTIVIEPSNPQVVYVPTYNPTTIYGSTTPVYSGYSGTDLLAASLLSFGAGIAVGALTANAWGCNWGGGGVTYYNNAWIARNSVWGPNRWGSYNPYNPYHPYNPYNPYHPYNPYNPYHPYNPNHPYNPYNPNHPYNPYHPYTAANHPYNPALHPINPAYHPYQNHPSTQPYHPYGQNTGYHPTLSGGSHNLNNFRGYDAHPSTGFENRSAFASFDHGGNTRMASDRGFSSFNAGHAAGGWGRGGGGFARGGGGGFNRR
jgi:hypothetical protein